MTAPAKSLGSISIFFPAFNDEQTIGELVRHALAILPTYTSDYEVLVINDDMESHLKHHGSQVIPGTKMSRSLLMVPFRVAPLVLRPEA